MSQHPKRVLATWAIQVWIRIRTEVHWCKWSIVSLPARVLEHQNKLRIIHGAPRSTPEWEKVTPETKAVLGRYGDQCIHP